MSARRPLIVPSLVVTEVAYLLGDRIGARAERLFGESFRLGDLVAEPVEPADWERICELVDDYADLPLGLVDASVIAAAERLRAPTIATLDHRHFAVVRPRHREAFELVP